jgi:hypothetical protein
MPASQRIEIVRTDAEQAWHVRTIRNKKTFISENYLRKVGAERAALGLATLFGWESPALTDSMLIDTASPHTPIPVVYIDERLTSTAE